MKEEKKSNKELEELENFDLNEDNNNFDWLELTQKLLAIRKKLLIAALCGAVIGFIISWSMPKKYTVGVTLSPEMPTNSKNSSSFVGMAASLLGAGFGQSGPDAINALLAPNIVGSTPFLLHLLNARVVSQDGKIDTTLSAYLDTEKGSVLGYAKQIPSKVLSAVRSLYNEKVIDAGDGKKSNIIHLSMGDSKKMGKLRENIVVAVDKSTITSISVTLQDPKVTAIVADSVVSLLQQTIIQYRIAKAKEDVLYWEQINKERQNEYYEAQKCYADFVDAHPNSVFQSTVVEQERLQNDMNLALQVYGQVAQQLQMARAKVQEDKPAFTILEPAVIPLYPSSMSRIVIFLIIVFGSIGLTISWIFWGRNNFTNFKNNFWNKLKI